MALNDDLFDRELHHTAMLRRYENKLNRDIDGIYRKHRNLLRSAVVNGDGRSRITRIRREVRRAHAELFRGMSAEMKRFIIQERNLNINNLERSLGSILRIKKPNSAALINQVVETPIFGSRTMAPAFAAIATGEIVRVESLVRRATRDGLSIEQVSRQLFNEPGALKISRSQARALVRTAVTEFSTQASERVYEENSDVLRGYEYVATLDSRTSAICSSLDGRLFRPGDTYRPMPPQHWNCRSTTVPVVKQFSELEDVPQFKKNVDVNSATRASINGQVAAKTNYDSWLKRQSQSTKLLHFDNSTKLTAAFNAGVPLRKLVNTRTKSYVTLETLQKLRDQYK